MPCSRLSEDLAVLWRSAFPYIPNCLSLIKIPLTLLAFVIVFGIPYIIMLWLKKDTSKRRFSLLFILQYVVLLTALANYITQLIYSFTCCGPPEYAVLYLPGAIIAVLAFLAVVWNIERLKDAPNSGICFFIITFSIISVGSRCWNHLVVGLFPTYQITSSFNMTSATNITELYRFPWDSRTIRITDLIGLLTFITLLLMSVQSERMFNYRSLLKQERGNKKMHAGAFEKRVSKCGAQCTSEIQPSLTERSAVVSLPGSVNKNQAPCPERYASFLSRITYAWFLDLIIRGYRKPLEMCDLWPLDEKHTANYVTKVLLKHLSRHIQPGKSINYYLERRRMSLLSGTSINWAVDSRRSTQASLGNCSVTRSVSGTRPVDVDLSKGPSKTRFVQNNAVSPDSDLKEIDRHDVPAESEHGVADHDRVRSVVALPSSSPEQPEVTFRGVKRFQSGPRSSLANNARATDSRLPSLVETEVLMNTSEHKRRTDLNTTRLSNAMDPLVVTDEKERTVQKGSSPPPSHVEDVNTPNSPTLSEPRRQGPQGFIKALFRTYWWPLLWTAFLKLVHDILAFLNPMLLKLLLGFMEADVAEPVWHGYLFAVLMFLVAAVQTLVLQHYFKLVSTVGLHVRTAITTAVYKKSLLLTNTARQESTTGQIVNLVASDAQQFAQLMVYIHVIWSGPFQIVVAITLLWRELGPAVLAGVGMLLLLLPLNAMVARISKTLQEKKSKVSDSRIKMISEILNGIRVIKLYAWEPSFIHEVNQLRQKELRYLRHFTYLQSISFLWTCAPFLVALCSFGVYVLMSEQNLLDAQKAFVSLSLFNLLRFPLFMFPAVTSSLVQTYVSCRRLNTFLRHTELDPDNCSHEDTPGVAAVIERGVFGWNPQEDPVLRGISIQFPEGQLTSIVGTVGSGKSSLLHALLGDMERFDGRVNVKGSVAYVPQEPWIFNATLRENVLFLRPYDPVRYEKIIEACGLVPDLKILPNGDQTEIGDKGVNLSGGQKQRVSLARACYADADIYLLDDPLSAVDAHVGAHLLKEVLSRSTGLLASKTCILATHSAKSLPFSDRIVILSDGQISETGTYRQLINSSTGRLTELIAVAGLFNESDPSGQMPEQTVDEQSVLQIDGNSNALTRRSHDDVNVHGGSPTVVQVPSRNGSLVHRSHSGRSSSSFKSRKSSTDPVPHRNRTMSNSTELAVAVARGDGSPYIFDSVVSLADQNENAAPEKSPASQQQKSPMHPAKTEQVKTGRVKWSTFKIYLRNVGLVYCFLILTAYPLSHLATLGTNLWLSAWADDAKLDANLTRTLGENPEILRNLTAYPEVAQALGEFHTRRDYRLGVYAAIGFVLVVTTWVSLIAFAIGHLACAHKLHSLLLNGVLHAPASFFDLVPQGLVVNRFSQDIATLDDPLLNSLKSTLTCFLHCFLTLCTASSVNPWILIPITCLTILYMVLQNVYVSNSRQLKRLESAFRSPVFSHFTETLLGVNSIRAYTMQDMYVQIVTDRQDKVNTASYLSMIAQRWLAVLLEFVGNFIVLSVGLFCVATRGQLTAGFSGLVLTYALNLNQALNWLVRMTAELESNIVCVERIEEYAKIEPEAPWEIAERKPPSSWPSGEIEFVDFGLRYRPEFDLVLRSVSFKIGQRERVGIVGRTGSGKSSLVMGLFRMLEASEGRILIDGLDIAEIGLHDLRRRLTLIPQDPVLFSGTLRFNLDPFRQHTDEAIWNSLDLANLKGYVKETSNNLGLDMVISEGGSNISMGQRQLLCLARALLRHTPILVLDEATAAVDPFTDSLIQETIRNAFSDCTVLTIAHRLNTIMDYDRVIVLHEGQLMEFGNPKHLLQDVNSRFYSLAKDAHLVE